MLTCIATLAGMLLVLGIGGFIVEHTPVSKLVDRLTRDLPMNWEQTTTDD